MTKQYYNESNFQAHCVAYTEAMNREHANAKFARDIASPDFRYSRFRPNFGVTAYMFNAASPTGVLAGATAWTLEDAKIMLDARGRSFPLSPTEGLNKSGV